MSNESFNTQFCALSKTLNNEWLNGSFGTLLQGIVPKLARSAPLREEIGTAEPSIWESLLSIWERESHHGQSSSSQRCQQVLLLAKFTRNLVAGCTRNQNKAFIIEPTIRALIHEYSSWSAVLNEENLILTRMLPQTISNMLTGNNALITEFWNTHLALPMEQSIILYEFFTQEKLTQLMSSEARRLLGIDDADTSVSTFVLLLNCLHGSGTRIQHVLSTPTGIKISIALLDRIAAVSTDTSVSAARVFDIGYALFVQVVQSGSSTDCYRALAVEGETSTPHQTTFLRLLDSYLQSQDIKPSETIDSQLVSLLTSEFLVLSGYIVASIQESRLQSLDLLLPRVAEALILVTQCLTTIFLHVEKDSFPKELGDEIRKVVRQARHNVDKGVIEELIAALQLVNEFLPRLSLGREVFAGQTAATTAVAGFEGIKRDLVRLLGLVVHDSREAQDRVRLCGGIEAVMNMCVIDDQNPFLREHAILTLRNILHDNAENQNVVAAIKPMGTWNDSGVLVDTPGAVRR